MTPNDVKIVADNIDDFIEVPNGVSRLRKAVLSLAVSGKLVAEEKGDGSSELHYKKIQEERFKQVKNLEDIDSITTVPYEIPKSWKWVRLGEVCEFIYGDGLARESRVEGGKYNAYGANGPLARTNLINCENGGVIVGRKGSAGAVTLVSEPFFATDVTYYIPSGQYGAFEVNYLYLLLLALDLPQHAKGIKPGISRKEVYNLPVALPPIPAQKRIVKKTEELMKQLDDLEVKKRERDETRVRLVRSAMQSLGRGESKAAFEQLTELVKVPSDVKELENALLTLAVSGKLVPQKKTDVNADELYAEIQKRRANSVVSRRKKTKELIAVTQEDIPFSIPNSWKWVRMSELVELITDGEHISPEKHADGVPLVTAKNVIETGVTFHNVDYVTKEDAKKFWARCYPEKGDLLICSRGTIGRTTVVDIESPFCLMGSVILIKFFDNITSDYCKYYLRTHSGVSQIGLMRKGMAVGALYLKDIEKALIPLPPLSEQKRIVKKVEEVTVLINRLKQII